MAVFVTLLVLRLSLRCYAIFDLMSELELHEIVKFCVGLGKTPNQTLGMIME